MLGILDPDAESRWILTTVEGENHFPCPAGLTALDAPRDALALLAHVKLLVSQHPQILLRRAALNPFSSQSISELDGTFLFLSCVLGSSPFQKPHFSSGRSVVSTPFLAPGIQ